MTDYKLDNFNFSDFLDFIIENDSDNGIYLGRLVDFDVRMIKEYPSFLDEVVKILKELGLITSHTTHHHHSSKLRFAKIKFYLKKQNE